MRTLTAAEELERRAALQRYAILDTPLEPEFDRVTALAARLFEVPTALIVLVDADRQWFKSHFGLAIKETHRNISFCSLTIENTDPLVVSDAINDSRFSENPLVVDAPHIRFYAGAPLRTPDGHNIGSLSLIDYRPVISHRPS